jgi:hypothetical protein
MGVLEWQKELVRIVEGISEVVIQRLIVISFVIRQGIKLVLRARSLSLISLKKVSPLTVIKHATLLKEIRFANTATLLS